MAAASTMLSFIFIGDDLCDALDPKFGMRR